MSTFASVTEIVCTCDYLQKGASNPDHPIEFDARLNEFLIVTRNDAGDVKAKYSIYHCPFCGGKTPESLRDRLFATVTDAEDHRLRELFEQAKSVEDVILLLGAPDREHSNGYGIQSPERDGQPPLRMRHRTLHYTSLSQTADVMVVDYPSSRVGIMIQGKYIGTPDESQDL
jgi:hypothetical protein